MGDVIYGWPVIQNSRSLGGFHILRHREGVTKIVTFLNKLISKIDDKGGGGQKYRKIERHNMWKPPYVSMNGFILSVQTIYYSHPNPIIQ